MQGMQRSLPRGKDVRMFRENRTRWNIYRHCGCFAFYARHPLKPPLSWGHMTFLRSSSRSAPSSSISTTREELTKKQHPAKGTTREDSKGWERGISPCLCKHLFYRHVDKPSLDHIHRPDLLLLTRVQLSKPMHTLNCSKGYSRPAA